jgi:tetratricopeptide (TPR) repeat protein
MAVESKASGDAAAGYLDVLLLCAAPVDVRPALNLAVEVANFEAEVRRSPIPIRLRRVFPPSFEQLQRELSPPTFRQRAPRVFHFLGHGEEDYLWFEDEEGSGDKVTAARLRRLFEFTPIRLAFLNACWSATPRVKNLCVHLVEGAGLAAAIGHGKPVADASAIAFAHRFYAEITRGQSIKQAYFAGRNALAEKGLPSASEIDLTGDGDLRLDEGLAPGDRPGPVEDGMPTRGYLPGADFFCGRAQEFLQVARTLADPNSRGFGIWGIGGIGKTALAKEAARRNAWRFRDGGVVFVDTREVAPPTTAELLRRTLARLDPAARGDDPVFELVTRLTEAPGLIVLDNLETLPEVEYDALARFVGQVPRNGSHVLLTARAPIRPIADLPEVPTLLLTTGLHEIDGAHYAHRLAETKGVSLLRDDPPRIEAGQVRGLCARVSRRVSGHPKMIEVAVGVARRGREELDKALDRLEGDLETKLAEMLATGLALVGDEGRRLLAFLPLFPAGNFMPEAMRAACAAAGRATVEEPPTPTGRPSLWGRFVSLLGRPFRKVSPAVPEDEPDESDADAPAWVVEGIRQLERGGFLDRDQEMNLCTFHQTLRDYAERVTDLTPERSSAGFSGLLLFYAAYLRDNRGNYEAIDRCLDNSLTAMEMAWATRRGAGPLDAVLAGMVDDLNYIFDHRGHWQLGDRWNERAIALRRGSDSAEDVTALAHELFRHAGLVMKRGRYEVAKQLYRESLQLNERAANLRGQASSLHQLAIIESAQGNHDEARQLLKQSLGIFEDVSDQQGLAASLHQVAIIESEQGNPDEARRLIQRSLGILEGIGDLRGQAASLYELARIELAQCNPDEARRLLQRSRAILEGLGDLRGTAGSLHQLAIIESAQDNPAEARRLLQRSRAILEGLGDLRGTASSLHQLAIIESRQGNPAEARRLWKRSIALKDHIGDVDGRASTLIMLAQLEAVEGNIETALAMARESDRLLEGTRSGKAATVRAILADLETAGAGGSAQRAPADVSERKSAERRDERGSTDHVPDR